MKRILTTAILTLIAVAANGCATTTPARDLFLTEGAAALDPSSETLVERYARERAAVTAAASVQGVAG